MKIVLECWLVTFMHYDFGYFDDETCRSSRSITRSRSETVTHLSGRNEVLPMSPEWAVSFKR
jgi:hypothetical protein